MTCIVLYTLYQCINKCDVFWVQSSLNGSASNLPDSTGRSYTTSFSGQSGAASPVFHHNGGYKWVEYTFMYASKLLKCNVSFAGTMQALHNIHGSFNVPNMPGTLTSRNSTLNNVPSGGVQQPTGSLASGRFPSNNLPLSQVP